MVFVIGFFVIPVLSATTYTSDEIEQETEKEV